MILAIGAILTLGVSRQKSIPLERSLSDVVPLEINGFSARDVLISDSEAQVAGFSNYLFRIYEFPVPTDLTESAAEAPEPLPWFSLYVGYYESQAQGKTIHSPKNCLPGAGWEALSSNSQVVESGGRSFTVNRYLLQNEGQRALVLYWYQGRGRIASDEYWVKFNLLRDAALMRRSDEALVRIVVPVTEDGAEAATETAVKVAQVVAPLLDRALPSR